MQAIMMALILVRVGAVKPAKHGEAMYTAYYVGRLLTVLRALIAIFHTPAGLPLSFESPHIHAMNLLTQESRS